MLISKSKSNAAYWKKYRFRMSRCLERFNKKGFHHYDVIEPGFKYNMTDLSASMGINGLKIKKNLTKRKKICNFTLIPFKTYL